jgi:hypothetical protein
VCGLVGKVFLRAKFEKLKNPTTTIFIDFFFLSLFETELLEKQSFLKSKKNTNEQQLYDVCSVKVVIDACLNLFFY